MFGNHAAVEKPGFEGGAHLSPLLLCYSLMLKLQACQVHRVISKTYASPAHSTTPWAPLEQAKDSLKCN